MHLDVRECSCCCCCVAILLLLLQQLLLAAAVRHRVLDGKNCCWFIESDSIQCFLSLHSNTIKFYVQYMYARTPWQYCRFYCPDLPTSSVITGMHGAEADVSPPRRSPLYINRAFHGVEPRFFSSRNDTMRFGAVFLFWESYGAVWCGYPLTVVSYGAVERAP